MIEAKPRPLRRSILYGACLGLLAGLALVALRGAEGTAAIALWRNAIVAGAAVGLAAGLIRLARGLLFSGRSGHSGKSREPVSSAASSRKRSM